MAKKLHQTYLWIGPSEHLKKKTETFLRALFCKKQSCGVCVDCRGIADQKHHAITWLAPENYYTVKQLEVLFSAVRFALDDDQKHIILIQRADLLTSASGNSLLKALEEPSAGYHYILLAPRTEGILPTIRSRCVVENEQIEQEISHRLLPFFTDFRFDRASELLKECEKERVPERDIDQLLDACTAYWHRQYKMDHDLQKKQRAMRVCEVLIILRKKPPMPGSSKLFLKNLYLRLSLAFS